MLRLRLSLIHSVQSLSIISFHVLHYISSPLSQWKLTDPSSHSLLTRHLIFITNSVSHYCIRYNPQLFYLLSTQLLIFTPLLLFNLLRSFSSPFTELLSNQKQARENLCFAVLKHTSYVLNSPENHSETFSQYAHNSRCLSLWTLSKQKTTSKNSPTSKQRFHSITTTTKTTSLNTQIQQQQQIRTNLVQQKESNQLRTLSEAIIPR